MVLMLAWLKDASGNAIAGAGASLKIETVQETVKNIKYGDKGYGMLISGNGTVIEHPNEEWIMSENVNTSEDEEPEAETDVEGSVENEEEIQE